MSIHRYTMLLVFFVGIATAVIAQDGQHVFAQYNLERNTWTLKGYEKVTATVAYPEINYYRGYGSGSIGGGWELSFSGLFSGFMGFGSQLASDDSLYITNAVICDFTSRHNIWELTGDNNTLGIVWGLDFMGYELARDGVQGELGSGEAVGSISGMGLTFGTVHEYNLDEKLFLTSELDARLVYNSESAKNNEKTFHAKGFRFRTRARYYLTYNIVAKAEWLLESLNHNPTDANDPSDDGGEFFYNRLSFGIGVQW